MAVLLLAACRPPPRKAPLVCGSPQQHFKPAAPTQCGATLEFTPVNQYSGEFSPVMDREDAVVLVNGLCTGNWIQAAGGPVVLTAGHCAALGDRPVIDFNYEDNPDGERLITEGTVFEQSSQPDYALIQLDAVPVTQPLLLTAQTDERLAIIQHPRGLKKVIAEGWFEAACKELVYYSDLDTLVGSSGAGVLTRQGDLLGIHTSGDCDLEGYGTNRGWTAQAIVDASPYLVDGDLLAAP